MPQLNPTPWLMVMLITWLALLIMMAKTLNSNPITPPTIQSLKTSKPPLIWPWH
uniref:ATP synthase complex subunit 8 n=1 Tax=Diploderma micangshanense TaxID=2602806 RepID=A0A7T3U578_9SAUR|nr:ATP synthase F0 subunit 8 [Diploderma micangshanensis]QPZ51729.1 ATP synthase F0 subunit 8 [Diploderma micangshanensis]